MIWKPLLAETAMRPGGTRFHQNLMVGVITNGVKLASEPSPGQLFVKALTSAKTLCLCHPSSISALMSMRGPWLMVGQPLAPVPRSAKTFTCQAASALAAYWNRCKPDQQSLRTIVSSARARKLWKAVSFVKAQSLAWACSLASQPKS